MAFTATDNQHDDYWKLRVPSGTAKQMKEILARRGYYVNAGLSKEQLKESLCCSELGHISYYGHSNHQLRQFIKDRRIEGILPRKDGYASGSRTHLRSILTHADKHPSFTRFLDLPAELRNMIYKLYFASFAQPIYCPTQPPLTLICRAIRQETLGIFYSDSTFRLLLLWPEETLNKPPGKRCELIFPSQLLQFLNSTRVEHFSHIQKLEVEINMTLARELGARGSSWSPRMLLRVSGLNIGITRTGRIYGPLGARPGFLRALREEQCLKLQKRLKEFVQPILGRSMRIGLRKEDVFVLRWGIEKIFDLALSS